MENEITEELKEKKRSNKDHVIFNYCKNINYIPVHKKM